MSSLNFLLQHVDLLLGIFLLLETRNNLVDFPYPWVKSSAAVMIPSPKADDSKNNQWNKLDAVFKPFQSQVSYLMPSISCMMTTTFHSVLCRFGSVWVLS